MGKSTISLKYQLTDQDLLRFNQSSIDQNFSLNLTRSKRNGMKWIMLFALLWIIATTYAMSGEIAWSLVVYLGGYIFIFFPKVYSRLLYPLWFHFLKHTPNKLQTLSDVELSEWGFKSKSQYASYTFAWKDFAYYEKTHDVLLGFVNSRFAVIIPRRAVSSSQQWREIFDLVSGHVASRASAETQVSWFQKVSFLILMAVLGLVVSVVIAAVVVLPGYLNY